MLPVARGANGQPPIPPTDASKMEAPHSSAAHAFANPVERVLCRCTPTGRANFTASRTTLRTWVGVATPTVSAKTISSAPSVTASSASPSTRSGGTTPSNGQPNATEIETVAGTPSRFARSRMRPAVASASSTVAFALRLPNESVAANVKCTRSRPVVRSRS